jgi:hypothetical protein
MYKATPPPLLTRLRNDKYALFEKKLRRFKQKFYYLKVNGVLKQNKFFCEN